MHNLNNDYLLNLGIQYCCTTYSNIITTIFVVHMMIENQSHIGSSKRLLSMKSTQYKLVYKNRQYNQDIHYCYD